MYPSSLLWCTLISIADSRYGKCEEIDAWYGGNLIETLDHSNDLAGQLQYTHENCQKECFDNNDCKYFNFEVSFGKCHLYSSKGLKKFHKPGNIVGPKICTVPTVKKTEDVEETEDIKDTEDDKDTEDNVMPFPGKTLIVHASL